MEIREIHNDRIELRPPKFRVDRRLTKREIAPFPNVSGFFNIVVGAPGAGKSSCVVSSLCSKKIYGGVFDKVYVICPASSRYSLRNNPFECLDQDNVFDELTMMTLHRVEEALEASHQEDRAEGSQTFSLLYMDDIAQSLKGQGGQVLRMLSNLILNRRHKNCSIILATQYWNALPLQLRKAASDVTICHKPINSKELNAILEELFATDKPKALEIINFVFRKKYDKLFVNLDSQTFYRNLNRLQITEAPK